MIHDPGNDMKLYLTQHGEACSKQVDPRRPLTSRGEREVQRIAEFLQRAEVRVERVLHSGKLRAMQTADILAKAIAPGVELEENGLMNPNDDPHAFDWQSGSWDRDLLVVGHLPFMAKLVSDLLVGDENQLTAAFQPGTIVCLERTSETHWQIDWMLRPELFAKA
jgi:phosphohistidine phosphatase